MPIGEVCNREVVIVAPSASVAEAAGLMRRHHVGDLVVVEERGGRRVPVGMLTDRDIVVEVVARGRAPAEVAVADVMARDPVTATVDEGLWDVVKHMRRRGVRRVPVVGPDGALEGLATADDLLELLGEEVWDLARLAVGQRDREAGGTAPG